ncbi:MAG TPA: LPS assembly lipoprotein LptE [Caulobacteraceae bacterium]
MKRVLAAIAVALTLAGCGFTPMYARPGLASGLSSIEVVAPRGRVGELLREELEDALGRNVGERPAYRLELAYAQTRIGRGLREDNTVSRYEVELPVDYRLVDASTGGLVHAGHVDAEVTYDSVDAPYASIAAQQDAESRAAADAARRIHLQLASWFAGR